MKCEYNNSCYETAKDLVYIEYDWNVPNNLEAEFRVSYRIEGVEHELDVCEGCKADIESNCEDYDDSEFYSEIRLRPQTESYAHRRSVEGHYYIRKPWTQQEHDAWFRKFHKQTKKHEGQKCTEECYN